MVRLILNLSPQLRLGASSDPPSDGSAPELMTTVTPASQGRASSEAFYFMNCFMFQPLGGAPEFLQL